MIWVTACVLMLFSGRLRDVFRLTHSIVSCCRCSSTFRESIWQITDIKTSLFSRLINAFCSHRKKNIPFFGSCSDLILLLLKRCCLSSCTYRRGFDPGDGRSFDVWISFFLDNCVSNDMQRRSQTNIPAERRGIMRRDVGQWFLMSSVQLWWEWDATRDECCCCVTV